MTAVLFVLCCAACVTVKNAPEDARFLEAQKAFDEGQRLTTAGQYTEAVPHVERALNLREAVLGEMHPEVASCLDLLGRVHWLRGGYADAESLLQRALTIREAALGKSHPDVATSLNNLADIYKRQELYARAEPLYERALAIQEASLGKNHPDVATSLSRLADLYYQQWFLERAGPLDERALTIREAALDKNHPDVAASLSSLAHVYFAQGHDKRAEPLFERALAIREATLGKSHPATASSLNILGNLYFFQGHYELAEPLFERALAIREAALGKDHPDVARSLNSLANFYRKKGLYAQATSLYQRALAIREAALGKNHPEVADSLNDLACLYWAQGLYVQAEPLFERAITILEATHNPALAFPLHNLASLYAKQGLYAQAEPLLQRALAVKEATFGKSHAQVAEALADLASIYEKQGYYERAKPLLQRALAIREAALGKNHPDVARSLNSLAALHEQQGHFTQAEPLLQRALVIQEAALGKTHPYVAQSLHNLASLHEERGDYARAESLFQRALAIRESTLGKNHPDIAQSLNRLARLCLAQQRLSEALSLFERAFSVSEEHLRQEVFGFSEARLASVLHLLRVDEERLYALARAHLDDARVRQLALTAALLRKGRSVEELADTSRIIYRDLGQADHEAFDRLRALRTEFATLSLVGPGKLSPAEYQQRLKALADQSDSLEADLSRRSALLRALHALPSPAEFIDKVATALPSDGALKRFFSTLRADLADQQWPPLPGTQKEAEAIQRLLPQAQLLLGPAATKQALLRLETPGLLHIATHAFFLEDAPTPAATRAVVNASLLDAGPARRPADPLLRSGLVLANALAQGTQPGERRLEDSLVTALELAGMDLWGTQLVVLSACETGRGDVKLGQGVYGLRRALVVAGAETVVTSLWKVDDETTHELMEGYYRKLLAGQGRTSALREAMRELRQKKSHPYYWAPFITIGQDTPLQGLVPHTEAQPAP
ncbi:tetratricopeptide repeat protein [Archangium sp.]|uniref:CHAT domain-containing tetratricopeptide repeat protein n=1 Tax=Archangium sp. TaxID=1872627 RepID=UPI00286A6BE9|nr:tetratricopeptide repeat protein [Archangium sp.]